MQRHLIVNLAVATSRHRIYLAILTAVSFVGCGAIHPPEASTDSTLMLSDSFHRPNQMGLGSADTGQTWNLTGPGASSAQINNNSYMGGTPAATPTGNTIYAFQLFPDPVARVDGSFTFHASGGGTNNSAVAISISSDPANLISQMIHLCCTRENCYLTWWNGEKQNQPPASCSIANPHYYRLDMERKYDASIVVNGDKATVFLPDASRMDCQDPNFLPLTSGRGAFWEVWYDASTFDIPSFNAVAARK